MNPAYGTIKERQASVSYAEIEQAALSTLAAGSRPSVHGIREKLGRGSATTIASALQRFWRDLGIRAQGDPATLSRLPLEISDAVETIWQRALTLAAQSAKSTQNGAQEHLERLRIQNEVREQSLLAREREYEAQARERERALADTRSHLHSTMRMLETDRQALKARDARITDLESQIEEHRQALAKLVDRAIERNRLSRPRRQAIRDRRLPISLGRTRASVTKASARTLKAPKSKTRVRQAIRRQAQR